LKQVAIIAGDRRPVVGVTSINSLFVLRAPSQQQIQVYDLKSFKQQQTIQLIDLSDHSDNGLTSCVTNNCLFVSDYDKNTVYKVNLSSNNQIIKWNVGRRPCGLSINCACNLIVAYYYNNKIQEYNTTSGSLVREISLVLNDVWLRPLYAIQLLSNDQFVVSCWNETSRSCDVVEVDTKRRQIVVSYTNQLKSTTEHEFSYPSQLSVDKNEFILVADTENNRIVILNRSLKCDARELNVMMSVDGGLQEPSCLYFNESQNRLFVGERNWSGESRVLVFDNVI
jgi:DNA-binding beta-propeller fold protein YncE